MINLNLPDFVFGARVYDTVIPLVREYPEIAYEDTRIAAIFGCFNAAIWNGGGILLGQSAVRQQMDDCIGHFNYDLNVPLRFTFTNSLITENQCFDTYCNLIAEAGHNGRNEILTSSPILEKYLREHYPHYKFCRSIIAAQNEPYGDTSKYDLVVMRRNMNNNWDYLDKIPMQDRDKIEFLCCDPCPDNCPRIYSHYRDFARAQIEQDGTLPNLECSMGQVKGRFVNKYTRSLQSYISRETIEKMYVPRGYSQFKISGRTNLAAIIQGISNYYIKPEYQADVEADCINICC